MPWRNGYIPESELVIFRRGWNAIDGDWFWGLTPGTLARHRALVALAFERTGRILEPSEGWGTYRPFDAQKIARRIYGNGAATPGTSSHGGFWEGQETLAIDYSNWSWVYGGNRAQFYADCRAVSLTPGMIEPSRNYPDEPWHVIDKNPRSGAPASDGASPFTPSTKEEEDMTPEQDAKLQKILEAVTAPKPAAEWSLVRLADRPEVFLSTNRATLQWLKDERELELTRYTLGGANAPAAGRPVEAVGDLQPYGVIVGPLPADPVYAQFKA